MDMDRVKDDLDAVMRGFKPVRRTNPREGQAGWYYMMPKGDGDSWDFEIIDVPTQDTPNPMLGQPSAAASVLPQNKASTWQDIQNGYIRSQKAAREFAPTLWEMAKEYFRMKGHGYRYLDDYHHCKANFNAAQKNEYAADAARIAGDAKELFDYYKNTLYKKLTSEVAHQDAVHDLAVNRFGLQRGSSGHWVSAKDGCAPFRDSNPDFKEKYW